MTATRHRTIGPCAAPPPGAASCAQASGGGGGRGSARPSRTTIVVAGGRDAVVQGTARPTAAAGTTRFNGNGMRVVRAPTVNQAGRVPRVPASGASATEFVINPTGGPVPGVLQNDVRWTAR